LAGETLGGLPIATRSLCPALTWRLVSTDLSVVPRSRRPHTQGIAALLADDTLEDLYLAESMTGRAVHVDARDG
jgi:hypothetical protein